MQEIPNHYLPNHFELLGLKQAYDIDLKILEKQYFAMQIKYHPDKAKTPLEKEKNLIIAPELNKAYAILKDDLKRAEYILSLNNINLDSEEIRKSLNSTKLGEIWDELENVENTVEYADLEKIYNKYKLVQADKIAHLIMAFQEQNLIEATDITIQLKYLAVLLTNLQNKMKLCK